MKERAKGQGMPVLLVMNTLIILYGKYMTSYFINDGVELSAILIIVAVFIVLPIIGMVRGIIRYMSAGDAYADHLEERIQNAKARIE